MGALLGNGGIDYRSPSFDLGGVTASFKYNITPEIGDAVGEGGVAAGHVEWAGGQALGVDLAMGGLSVGGFVAEVDVDSLGAVTTTTGRSVESASDVTGYVKYTAGPVSFGYQQAYTTVSYTHLTLPTICSV